MGASAWVEAIAVTLFVAATVLYLGYLVFKAGMYAGMKKLRKELGIPGQRKLKKTEMLMHSAHDIMTQDLRYGRTTNPTDVYLWLQEYEAMR